MKNLSHIKKINEFLNAENSFSRNKVSICGTKHNRSIYFLYINLVM